jgi:glycosyltransferase involved in cell wall biosynthesis
MPLIGVEPGLMRRHQPRDPGEPVRLLFVGRLVPWKGTHIALRAFAMAREQVPDLHLTILGQGPDETRVRKLIDDLHLPRVELMDRLPEIDDVFALYGRSDVFVFPSLHESGGMAVLEAMGSSLPVVCLDLGGPAMTVTSECGIAVPALTPRQVVRDMADAIVRLASDGNLRAEMGRAARARVSEYAWDKKVSDLESAMANLAGRSS